MNNSDNSVRQRMLTAGQVDMIEVRRIEPDDQLPADHAKLMNSAINWLINVGDKRIDQNVARESVHDAYAVALSKYDASKGTFKTFFNYNSVRWSLAAWIANNEPTGAICSAMAADLQKLANGEEPTTYKLSTLREYQDRRITELNGRCSEVEDSDGEACEWGDLIGAPDAETPAEQSSRAERIAIVQQAIAKLPEKEQLVLVSRFGLNGEEVMTLEDTAKLVGLTLEAVRLIQKRSLPKLAKIIRASLAASAGNGNMRHNIKGGYPVDVELHEMAMA